MMKHTLNQVEARLQSLIESSVFLIPGKHHRVPLAHRLAEALQNNLQFDENGKLNAPDLFIIHVHPNTLDLWQNTEVVFSSLSLALQEIATDIGFVFPRTPVIRVSIDPRIAVEDVNITVSGLVQQGGYTAAILPENDRLLTRDGINGPVEAYLIVDGGEFFPLQKPVINIGRRTDNHLVINDPRVSRAHCQLRIVHNVYVLFDLNSTGGTYVNNIRINRQSLKGGDVISLGGVQLIYGEDTPGQNTGRLSGDDLSSRQSKNTETL
ncbi:MAG: FHA domain-containing protein [Anaerolineae bacterium]|nr:FHA domain-containing protein [Anaerolineae bacterium]